jgi:hypothetical protein
MDDIQKRLSGRINNMLERILNLIIGLIITVCITGGIMYLAFKFNDWMNRDN